VVVVVGVVVFVSDSHSAAAVVVAAVRRLDAFARSARVNRTPGREDDRIMPP